MKYEYKTGTPEYYATDLRWNSQQGTMQWRSRRGQDVMIVQMPFGSSLLGPEGRSLMERICEDIGEMDP